jgi:RsiW-degrading membrane proteinase PrsW (M82 family)
LTNNFNLFPFPVNLIILALAPICIIAFYIYFRDKYDKEPIGLLLRSLLLGIVITLPIILVESYFERFNYSLHGIAYASYRAFITAGLTEELFKYLAFLLFIWRSRHFNEKFDGIVYAVFISLGFAAVENILYVLEHGYKIGLVRAVTAVPAHALFGIVMGYRFGLARFYPEERGKQLFLAFFLPFLLHGFYDFFLMAEKPLFLVLFVPYIIYLWSHGFRRMKDLSDRSIFKPVEGERNDLPGD